MDGQDFDRIARALTTASARRALLRVLLALPLLGGLAPLLSEERAEALGRRRTKGHGRHRDEVSVQGPCGNGSGKANACKRHGQCCTGYCHKKNRCRCKKLGQSCTADRNCCPDHQGLTCQDGTCQLAAPACDVCPSGCPFSALQAAVDAAAPGDTIRICAGAYLGPDAIVDIDKDLTIIGAGDGADPATSTILDAAGTGQVLHMQSARTVTLQELRVTGGVGGGVFNEGDLTMTSCTVTGNSADSNGGPGGILSDGPLTMTDCTVSDNATTSGNVGGIRTFASPVLSLTRCTISGNVGGGGGLWVQGTGTLTETTITGNTGTNPFLAGGLYTDGGTTTLIDSTVSGNTAPNCRAIGMGTITGPGCAP